MPKPAKDLRLHVSFEEAIRRVIATPPHPKSKKNKRLQKAIKNQLAKN